MADVEVRPGLTIPDEELVFRFSRSSGPGGQHANTSDTRVELRFDVEGSQVLSEEQKARIRERLGNRVTADGVLVLTGDEHRSQTRNRDAVLARFTALLAEALQPQRPRKPTRRSRAAQQRRLEAKRQQAEKKARRRPPETT
ncbi:MAG: alternative ribosome rescue aminoacyl-tRNA hydrolase ArfB [Egibacteraceae bacterium]